LVKHVEEELLGDGVIALGFEGPVNLPEQQHVGNGRVAEEFLLPQNLGIGKLSTVRRDDGIALFHLQEAQQLRRIHNRQQVVYLKGQVVGQPIDVVAPALVEQ